MAEDHAAELGRRYLQARGEAARALRAGGARHGPRDAAVRQPRRGATRAARGHRARFPPLAAGFAAGVNAYAMRIADRVPAWMPVVEPSDPLAYGRMFGVLAARGRRRGCVEKYRRQRRPRSRRRAPATRPARTPSRSPARRTTIGPADPARQPAPRLVVALLGGARHRAGPHQLLRLHARRHPRAARRLQRSARLRADQQRARPRRHLRAAARGGWLRRATSTRGARDRSSGAGRCGRAAAGWRASPWSGANTKRPPLGPVVHRTADHRVRAPIDRPGVVAPVRGLLRAARTRGRSPSSGGRSGAGSRSRRTTPTPTSTATSSTRGTRGCRGAPDPARGLRARRARRHRAAVLEGHPSRERAAVAAQPRRRLRAERQQPAVVDVAARPARSGGAIPRYIERGQLSLRAQLVLEALDATQTLLARRGAGAEVHDAHARRRSCCCRSSSRRGSACARRPRRCAPALATRWPRGIAAPSASSRGAVLFERFVDIHDEQQSGRFSRALGRPQPMTTPRGLGDPDAALAALERAVADVRAAARLGARRVGRREPLPLRRPRSAGRWRHRPARRVSRRRRSTRARRRAARGGPLGPGAAARRLRRRVGAAGALHAGR